MELTPLRRGDRAEVDGIVVRGCEGLAIMHPEVLVVSPEGPYHDGGQVVWVDLSPDRGEELLGRFVLLHGTWDGRMLTDASVHDVGELFVQDPQAHLTFLERHPEGHLPHPVYPGEPSFEECFEVERPFFDDGSLVSRLRTEDGMMHVVAQDVDRVEAALRPLYRDKMIIVASPWNRQVLALVDTLGAFAEARGLCLSTSTGTGPPPDYVDRQTIGLRYVSEDIAALARGLPDGALDVDPALIRPLDAERGH